MGQVTIYIDTETERKMLNMIKKKGISKSKWIRDLIREKADISWPESIMEMSGAWNDFPSTQEIRDGMGKDVSRGKI